MMKRLFSLLVLSSMLALGIYAQSVAIDDSTHPAIAQFLDSTAYVSAGAVATAPSVDSTVVVVEPVRKKDSFRDHWTLGLKGGITYFRLKNEQTSLKEANGGKYGFASDLSHQFSIFTEYTFDYGLGLGAYFGNYSYNRQAALGTSIEFGVYSHISLFECLTWRNVPPFARRFHLFWDAGLGVSALWQNNQIIGDPSSDKPFWSPYAVVRTALQFEFMIRPHWGLMIEGEYHGYGRGPKKTDNTIYSSPWLNAGMLSGGVRYYFDSREKEADPKLDENDLPIRAPRKPKQREKRQAPPKNAVYVNVNITPEMIARALENGGSITVQATEKGVTSQSEDIESALRVLEEQGEGTVLINAIRFEKGDKFAESSEEQLTEDAIKVLDKIAGSLLNNNLWTKVNLLYMSDKRATTRASIIATYLRAKGVKNLSIKGYNTQSDDETSDLIVTIK